MLILIGKLGRRSHKYFGFSEHFKYQNTQTHKVFDIYFKQVQNPSHSQLPVNVGLLETEFFHFLFDWDIVFFRSQTAESRVQDNIDLSRIFGVFINCHSDRLGPLFLRRDPFVLPPGEWNVSFFAPHGSVSVRPSLITPDPLSTIIGQTRVFCTYNNTSGSRTFATAPAEKLQQQYPESVKQGRKYIEEDKLIRGTRKQNINTLMNLTLVSLEDEAYTKREYFDQMVASICDWQGLCTVFVRNRKPSRATLKDLMLSIAACGLTRNIALLACRGDLRFGIGEDKEWNTDQNTGSEPTSTILNLVYRGNPALNHMEQLLSKEKISADMKDEEALIREVLLNVPPEVYRIFEARFGSYTPDSPFYDAAQQPLQSAMRAAIIDYLESIGKL